MKQSTLCSHWVVQSQGLGPMICFAPFSFLQTRPDTQPAIGTESCFVPSKTPLPSFPSFLSLPLNFDQASGSRMWRWSNFDQSGVHA
jgi:hypothetical protein